MTTLFDPNHIMKNHDANLQRAVKTRVFFNAIDMGLSRKDAQKIAELTDAQVELAYLLKESK